MGLIQTVAPASEPVTLAEAKLWCKEDSNENDDLISGLIQAAREHVESFTDRQIVSATWQYTTVCFPPVFLLTKCPVASVTSIAYVDTNGNSQTLSASNYQVDIKSEPGRIAPAYGLMWPSTRTQYNAVTVTYVAGYSAIPEGLKTLILSLVAYWYDNRASYELGTIVAKLPLSYDALLWQYSVGSYH